MGKNTLTALLEDLRALILKSRPAYRDYLGENVEHKVIPILTDVVLPENGDYFSPEDSTFSGFSAGETYHVTLDGNEFDAIAFAMDGRNTTISNISASDVESGTIPPDWWSVFTSSELPAKVGCGASGTFVGKTISVRSDKIIVESKWSVKKLAYELLPDRLLSALSAAANTARKALTAANAAQSTANAAQSTANAAQTTADAAQTTADAAQSTADAAQSTADAAQSTADAAQSTAKTAVKPSKSGEDTCYYHMYNPYADYKPTTVSIGTRGGTALCIEVNKGSYPSAVFKPPVYGSRQANFEFQRASSAYHHPLITGIGGIVVYSSTPKSTKKFKITVDDAGTLSATEVTDTTT